MIKSSTFNQLLTYEGERFAQSFNITIERMLFFRWCQILVPKFWIGFQYWANVWNDSTICLWKTQQEVLDSPVLECRNWRSERPLWDWISSSYLIKYAHTGRSCDLLIFGIPKVNFLVRAIQFGMKGVLSRIYDISSGFCWIPIFVFFLNFLRVS